MRRRGRSSAGAGIELRRRHEVRPRAFQKWFFSECLAASGGSALRDLLGHTHDGGYDLLAIECPLAHRQEDRFENVFHADHVEKARIERAHVPVGEEARCDVAEANGVDDAVSLVALDFGHQVEDRLFRAFEILKKRRPRTVEVQVSCNLQATVLFARFLRERFERGVVEGDGRLTDVNEGEHRMRILQRQLSFD